MTILLAVVLTIVTLTVIDAGKRQDWNHSGRQQGTDQSDAVPGSGINHFIKIGILTAPLALCGQGLP
jgi:hypothetical protein